MQMCFTCTCSYINKHCAQKPWFCLQMGFTFLNAQLPNFMGLPLFICAPKLKEQVLYSKSQPFNVQALELRYPKGGLRH